MLLLPSARYGKLMPAAKDYRQTDTQYKAEHGLVLQGEAPLPEALQTFESVGFPPDIMDEVRHFAGACTGGPSLQAPTGGGVALRISNPTCRIPWNVTAYVQSEGALAAALPLTCISACMGPATRGCPGIQQQQLRRPLACAVA